MARKVRAGFREGLNKHKVRSGMRSILGNEIPPLTAQGLRKYFASHPMTRAEYMMTFKLVSDKTFKEYLKLQPFPKAKSREDIIAFMDKTKMWG